MSNGRVGNYFTETNGIVSVKSFFTSNNWLFREQPFADFGIDAHIEYVENGNPTGRLIALQVKSGDSYGDFNESKQEFTFYINAVHRNYWIDNSLPVVFLFHKPSENKTYYQFITDANLILTDKNYKLTIPKSQFLGDNNLEKFIKLSFGSRRQLIERNLFIYKKMIDEIYNSGIKCYITFGDWIHKSLNRTNVELMIGNQNKSIHIGYTSKDHLKVLENLLPWASFRIDAEFYEENADLESVIDMLGIEILNRNIYPYKIQCCEFASYRLEVIVNQLGIDFLNYQYELDKVDAEFVDFTGIFQDKLT